MVELYLRLTDRIVTPLLLVISVVLLLRGHNLPGGGFIAALLASAALTLQILAHGATQVKRRIGRLLQPAIGVGLLLAVGTALIGIIWQGAFFRSLWWKTTLLGLTIEIGAPQIFDVGVFLAVVGVTVTFLLGLSESVLETPRLRLSLRRDEEDPQ